MNILERMRLERRITWLILAGLTAVTLLFHTFFDSGIAMDDHGTPYVDDSGEVQIQYVELTQYQ